MAFDTSNPYFRHKVMTASPQELRLLLLDGALHFVDIGRQGLKDGDFEKVYEGFCQAKAIVMELMTSLNHAVDPDLCARMQSLYTYIYTLLVDASFQKSSDKADEARHRLEFERETWVALMEKLQHDQADLTDAGVPTGPSPSGTGAPASTMHDAPRRTLSVEG